MDTSTVNAPAITSTASVPQERQEGDKASNPPSSGTAGDPASSATAGTSGSEKDSSTEKKKQEETPVTVLSKGAQLQAHLQSLTTLKAHVTNLRKLPMHLLTLVPESAIMPLGLGSGGDDLAAIFGGSTFKERGSQAENVFRVLKETQQTLLSQPMQSALVVARDSEKRDNSDISTYTRRERKKRYSILLLF